jgi:O-antigen/teichoic acid export membrane protein
MVKGLITRRGTNEILLVLGGQAAFVLGGIVLAKGLALSLGPDGYGRWALIYSLIGLGNVLLLGPVGQWFLRNYTTSKVAGRLQNYYQFALLFVAIGMISALIVPTVFFWIPSNDVYLYYLAPFLALLFGTVIFLQTIFTAERRRGLASAVLTLDSWLKVAVAFIGFYFFSWTVKSWFFWFGMCSLVTVFLFYFGVPVQLKSISLKTVRSFPWCDLWGYSAPFVLIGILGAVVTQADKWIVAAAASEHAVGLYAAAFLVAVTPFYILSFVLSQFITPIVFATMEDGDTGQGTDKAHFQVRATVAVCLLVSSVFIVVLHIWGEQLIRLLTSDDFLDASPMLLPLSISGAVIQVGQLLTVPAMMANNTRALLPSRILHSLCFLGLAIYLSRLHGANGVAWAHLWSAIIFTGAMLVTYLRVLPSLKDAHG